MNKTSKKTIENVSNSFYIICHKLNFLIPIVLQPDGAIFIYCKLRLFDLTELKVCKI